MVFQGEEGKKTHPLRNKGQRDWYSEIEREESSRPPQNKGRPGEGREGGGGGKEGGEMNPLYSYLVRLISEMSPLL